MATPNPFAELDEPTAGPADPFAELADAPPPAPLPTKAPNLLALLRQRPRVSQGEALASSVARGGSFGFSDELAGLGTEAARRLESPSMRDRLVGSLMTVAGGPVTALPVMATQAGRFIGEAAGRLQGGGEAEWEPQDTYAAARDVERERQAAAREQFPKMALVGEVAGAVGAPIPVGSVAPGARVIDAMGQGAKVGAIAGAATGAGEARGGAWDTLKGMLTGGGAGAALGSVATPLLGKASSMLGQWAGRQAEESAVKAFVNPGIIDKLGRRGISSDDARKLARWALDHGVISAFDDAANIAQKADDLVERHGANIGKLLEEADAYVAGSNAANAPRNAAAQEYEAAKALRAAHEETSRKLGQPIPEGVPTLPATPPPPAVPPIGADPKAAAAAMRAELVSNPNTVRLAAGPAERTIEAVENAPAGSLARLWAEKSGAQRSTNWALEAPAAAELNRDVTRALTRDVYRQAETLMPPGGVDELRHSAQMYGQAAETKRLASEMARRELARSQGSLGAKVDAAAMTEALPEGVKQAANWSLQGAFSAAKRRGSSTAAVGMEALRKSQVGVPGTIKVSEYEMLRRFMSPEELQQDAADSFRASQEGKTP